MILLGPSWTIDTVRPLLIDPIDASARTGACSAATSRWSGSPAAMPGCGAYPEVTAGLTDAERRDPFTGTAAPAYGIGG